ncbi:hypothetical protein [Priestia koreensis]|uniref:hypothetical protein n=1 Tax=Priestia koreensis TaxID=284581 RepID=UPI001F572277|nr:hypothetical protein [Priestia koreensis]UNL85626.1 hypothetical protein IE339_03670 [Priestia koreensis]
MNNSSLFGLAKNAVQQALKGSNEQPKQEHQAPPAQQSVEAQPQQAAAPGSRGQNGQLDISNEILSAAISQADGFDKEGMAKLQNSLNTEPTASAPTQQVTAASSAPQAAGRVDLSEDFSSHTPGHVGATSHQVAPSNDVEIAEEIMSFASKQASPEEREQLQQLASKMNTKK